MNIQPGREPLWIDEYERAGGYNALRQTLKAGPEKVLQEVFDSNLRGRGGAGFPTGQKWKFVPRGESAPRPKYFIVNADEMEPGTFKDRMLIEGDPHAVVESTIISAYAIEASIAYIFIRNEYQLAAHRLRQAIAEAYQRGYVGKDILDSGYKLDLYVHISSGRYMCGEEGALLNALEGKRPIARTRPPHPTDSGLWGKPTVVNNLETVCNVRHIAARGAAWYKSLSKSSDGGTKIYGVSGKVNRPGLWELPMGTTIREIIEGHAGGMREGFSLRGFLPGGASTDFLLPQHLDTPMDFTSVEKAGSRLGTGTIAILDDKTCPVAMVSNLMDFFARESCGWCTPCREGLPWLASTLLAIEKGEGEMSDLEILGEHTWLLRLGHTFCALAPGAVEPLQSAMKFFRSDFEDHIRQKRCPWRT
jgi:NADH-quinone oxidoreductase subunit F